MACYCALGSSLTPSIPFLNRTKIGALKHPSILIKRSISCRLSISRCHGDDDDYDGDEKKKSQLDFVKISATLTVISASLPQPSFAANVSEKKRTKKKSESLTPQELESWIQGLPVVRDRISYTELLNLRQEGKLKHIIKPADAALKQRQEVVIVILDDSRAVRTVLPSIGRDTKFWDSWEEFKIDSLCVNAFSPQIKTPEIPSPYLGFFSTGLNFMLSFIKSKPQSKKALELKRAREALMKKRKMELTRMRNEREMTETAIRQKKKMEERKRKEELRMIEYKQSLRDSSNKSRRSANTWAELATNPNVVTALGLVFFFIFYRTVVLNYRKQKKDYDDRLKIERAEADERKKMRELEREMAGFAGEDDGNEAAEGGKNPYLKMAMQFVKSGARVRRAGSKRLPQYLERDVDVKFSDVAGLGKIRLELEEIVKFFTHGEMYRRRGVKIPG